MWKPRWSRRSRRPSARCCAALSSRPEYLFPRNLHNIQVDPEAIKLVVRNVVTNAVEAMDKGVIRFSAENLSHTQFFAPDRPAAGAGQLRLPPCAGPGARHLRESPAADFRALLFDAQRAPGPRPHHGAFVDAADGRNDRRRVDAGRRQPTSRSTFPPQEP